MKSGLVGYLLLCCVSF